MTKLPDTVLGTVSFDERGLVPVVAQDAESGEVLMLAYADREAVTLTLETKQAHYFSRSRGALWRKGATSGHTQEVVDVRYDCDADALLYRVRQRGAACHTGERSCFYRTLIPEHQDTEHQDTEHQDTEHPETKYQETSLGEVFGLLGRVVAARLRDLPEGSYVTRLHERGPGYVAQKVIEEAGETVVAALEHKDADLAAEAADLLFHLTVLLQVRGLGLHDVAGVLAARYQQRAAGEHSAP
jgi:phosphoribosyl-AMP cyclohydrolase / phosphoribosyl-ATP pyrophosphohydrolase